MVEHLLIDPALRIALAWQLPAKRPALAALFALDRRLATMVAQAREPVLAQIRLAWWREQIARDGAATHASDPLLEQIAEHWRDHASRLVPLVDGWENLLGDAPLSSEAIEAFAAGRGEALGAFADLVGVTSASASARRMGRIWALADLVSHRADPREREIARALATGVEYAPPHSRALRGLSVLGGLARRALERGEPLLHDRGAALAAIRLGMLGR